VVQVFGDELDESLHVETVGINTVVVTVVLDDVVFLHTFVHFMFKLEFSE